MIVQRNGGMKIEFPVLFVTMGVKFYVIGRGPTEDIQSMAEKDPDVIVTGQADDVRKYLGKLSVFVTPIRLGKGFRGKILEAMAMGFPVVTTREKIYKI